MSRLLDRANIIASNLQEDKRRYIHGISSTQVTGLTMAIEERLEEIEAKIDSLSQSFIGGTP